MYIYHVGSHFVLYQDLRGMKEILFFAKYVDYFKIEILQCKKSYQKYQER